jgi:hypothetical protein
MTAHTTQSAATSASSTASGAHAFPPRWPLLLALRNEGPVLICYGDSKKPPHLAPGKILIANLEFEFHLTHRKLSLLRISNRKYFAILCPNPRAHLVLVHPLLASPDEPCRPRNITKLHWLPSRLIYGGAIKNTRNTLKTSNIIISNRRQRGVEESRQARSRRARRGKVRCRSRYACPARR